MLDSGVCMGAAAVPFCPCPLSKSDYLNCPHALAWTMANLALCMLKCAVYSHPQLPIKLVTTKLFLLLLLLPPSMQIT